MKRCVRCRRPLSDEALFCPACGESQTDSKGDPLIGTIVGERYLVKEMLGRGASGTVYRARHVGLEREIALKLLHHHLSNDKAAIEKFRREATTVAAIENDHIIDVSDFGKSADGRFFIVMELLRGITLADLLKKGRLDPALGIDIVLQVGDGLTEAHALGYVHRDIRPGNIFLTTKKEKEYFVKLLDFGLSKLVLPGGDGLKSTIGFSFRDPLYLSPEQARGEPVDRRSDIYSLAVVLYHVLTGSPPFEGGDVTGVLDKHIESMPELPSSKNPEIPGALDGVVMKALAKNPESRYVTAFVFCEALRKAAVPMLKKEPRSKETSVSRIAKEDRLKQDKPTEKREVSRDGHGFDPSPEKTLLGHGIVPPAPLPKDMGEISAKQKDEDQTQERADKVQKAEQVDVKTASTPERPAKQKAGVDEDKDEQHKEESKEGEQKEETQEEQQKKDIKEEEQERGQGEEIRESEEKEESGKESQQETGATPPDPSMSQLWYAEGENAQAALKEIESDGEGEEGQKTLPALYEGWKPVSRLGDKRVFFGLIAAGVLIISILLAVLYTMKKDDPIDRKEPGITHSAEQIEKAPDGHPDREERKADPIEEQDSEKTKSEQIVEQTDGDVEEDDSDVLVIPGHKVTVSPDEPRAKPPEEPLKTDKKKIRTKTDKKPEPGVSPVEKDVSSSEQAKSQVEQGRAALRRGDLVSAGAHFTKARTMDSRNAGALRGLGEVAFEQERYPAAIQHFRSALRLSSDTRTMVLLGNAYFRAGNLSEAEKMYKRVLKRNPAHAEAKRNLELVKKRR